jgi:transcriptional regulator with PAS, ATPase and Fis domain
MNVLHFQRRTLVVADRVMQQTLDHALRAARTSAAVLLSGESGTGKELIARFIHEKSARANGPFISVNCAAVPEGLMEAEFFGFERGAFTGAISQRIGKFERANGGTLLLDEISEMPYGLQAKLLRVLQEGEIDRLGGKDPIEINCRIIATTNREPLKLIREGKFREDLYYRLNVVRIDCVPLKGRSEAIESLALEFAKRFAAEQGMDPVFGVLAMNALKTYSWPGNIRELQNTVERAVLQADTNTIEEVSLEEMDRGSRSGQDDSLLTLADVERHHILHTLESTDGNRSRAAEILGVTARTLRNKLKEYGE